MKTAVQWLAPPPLWQELSSTSDLAAYRRPAILRFATDTFMQDLQSILQNAPQTLRNYVAAGETWKTPATGLDAANNGVVFKLFQPTHQRFYLIASSLTCRMPGLPDHTVNTSSGESVVFVVRQLRPIGKYQPSDWNNYDPTQVSEYAWVPSTAGVPPVPPPPPGLGSTVKLKVSSSPSAGSSGSQILSGSQPGWMQATVQVAGELVTTQLVPGEEQIPLSLTHSGNNGSSRRIFVGLIPASRRQQYVAGRTVSNTNGGSGNGSGGGSSDSGITACTGSASATDPRLDLFSREIVGPWCALLDWWTNFQGPSSPSSENGKMAQMASALILYDFATFLSFNLPDVWSAISGTSGTAPVGAAGDLYQGLGSVLQQALVHASQYGPQFEQAGPDAFQSWPPSGYSPISFTDASLSSIKPVNVQTLVANALPSLSSAPPGSNTTPMAPLSQQPSNAMGDYYFVIRCVYLRPGCGCTIISPPSQPFQLANYFDSDAPARRIQVALPINTSAAALRKFDKGVAFLVSDELRKQMARAASLNDLSNGSFSGPGLGVGMICSFSIPIITICAFILLFVIVLALNLVFFWIPFFKICFPVPELKGK